MKNTVELLMRDTDQPDDGRTIPGAALCVGNYVGVKAKTTCRRTPRDREGVIVEVTSIVHAEYGMFRGEVLAQPSNLIPVSALRVGSPLEFHREQIWWIMDGRALEVSEVGGG